jgi:hypothetical protein
LINLPYVPTDLESAKTFEIRETQSPEGRTSKDAAVNSPLRAEALRLTSSTADQDVQRSVEFNRQVAMLALVPKQEEIASERAKLVVKKFDEGLSAHEEKRLLYVTWQLDRIDDALIGPALDTWEAVVKAEEDLAAVLQRNKERTKRAPRKKRL